MFVVESPNALENTIGEIIKLLDVGDRNYWQDYFEYHKKRLIDQDEPRKEIVRDILKCFQGGMGSFSDLVLHKNERALIEENNKLEDLKNDLYKLCIEEL